MFRRFSLLYQRNSSLLSSRFLSQKKTQLPTRLTVTPDNERMQVNVFDEKNEQALGRMPLIEADHLAKYRELLLVLVDQSANPPDVRLMTGRRLAELREDARAKRPDEHEEEKYEEFVVRLRSHIADNDLQTKMSQASAAHLKGATLRILIDFDHNTDASDKRDDEQDKFLQRLKPYLDEFAKVHTNSRSEHSIILIVPSFQAVDRAARKREAQSHHPPFSS